MKGFVIILSEPSKFDLLAWPCWFVFNFHFNYSACHNIKHGIAPISQLILINMCQLTGPSICARLASAF